MTKTFRHPRTGKIVLATDRQAALFGLIEVGKDAKPLAFTPIPEAKIAELQANPDQGSEEGRRSPRSK